MKGLQHHLLQLMILLLIGMALLQSTWVYLQVDGAYRLRVTYHQHLPPNCFPLEIQRRLKQRLIKDVPSITSNQIVISSFAGKLNLSLPEISKPRGFYVTLESILNEQIKCLSSEMFSLEETNIHQYGFRLNQIESIQVNSPRTLDYVSILINIIFCLFLARLFLKKKAQPPK
ncbi:MAG: hypothetical protein OI74_06860 [Gammaproteobacteria bacterium (ex Lamellibrachia satsuma)]|nr:MAG: hypothetical protein HPY30_08480 [Gammaproteobacteria bacterium (ex Lamellibrachia satsuma)]RRS33776.1 MAG: hypothetical protein OI74_06860 [Gammaproteobacteria bacterium (ex Lamellibrachia satsuma)]RRS37570.1 MAG: hypothetical protein NV67_00490 [Gammaproteobacteria bacterium (ex Lamellibrachia satsuma)]